MTGERHPSRPIDAYKEIIDQLVAETSHGVTEKLVVREGGFLETSDDRVFNPFLKALSTEQRQTLAQMLHAERIAAIHDVLAVLTWWMEAREAGFTFRVKQCLWASKAAANICPTTGALLTLSVRSSTSYYSSTFTR
jgi:Family of unknown function (DUF6547)